MKKYIFTILILVVFKLSGQTGINQDAAPNANLDIVKSTDKNLADGFSIPKMTVSNLYDQESLYSNDQESILVYVTDVSSPAGATSAQISSSQISEIRKVGFYWFDASSNKWKSFNTDHGNGSFTPKVAQIPIPADTSTKWWTSYINLDINYFEIITGVGGSITFPDAADFENRTIYINNGTNYNLTLLEIPQNLDTSYPANSSYQDLGQITFIESTDVLQLYSDGTRWYLTGGRN